MPDPSLEFAAYRELSDAVIDELVALEAKIFDSGYSTERFRQERSRRQGWMAILCRDEGRSVGYKIGYEMNERVFYSWVGGVLESHRGRGIARGLMEQQHRLAAEAGYQKVRTHTYNKFRSMLILNLRTGFDIVGLMKADDKEAPMIMLEKKLLAEV